MPKLFEWQAAAAIAALAALPAAAAERSPSGQDLTPDGQGAYAELAGATDLSFTAPLVDLGRLRDTLQGIVNDIGAERYEIDEEIAKVSLVGAGMKSHPGVAADMFDALAADGINIEMISTSPIRISCVVRRADGPKALRTVHARFGLDESGLVSDN